MSASIRLAPAFTEAEASGYAKRSWWVRNESVEDGQPGRWVDTMHLDGTRPLCLDLGPGRYVIGAGPHDAYRREIRVGRDGEEITVPAPCLTPGCSGLIEFRPSSPPPACEAFELSPPAARLCSDCETAP